ncbi:MAG: hypothetical protein HLX50_18640 [Alteromonadaceae bacterium]|nr:hypothetical protein [Alteromonadaceae bacterium]
MQQATQSLASSSETIKTSQKKPKKKQITSFPDSVAIMQKDTARQQANTGKTVHTALTGLQSNIELYAK